MYILERAESMFLKVDAHLHILDIVEFVIDNFSAIIVALAFGTLLLLLVINPPLP